MPGSETPPRPSFRFPLHRMAAVPILAEASQFQTLVEAIRTNRFSLSGADLLHVALVTLGTLLVLSFTLRGVRQVAGRLRRSPLVLYCQMCRAHGLSWTDCRLLWRIGRAYRLEHPAAIFIAPERFDPARLGSALRLHEARIVELREMLFAEPAARPHSRSLTEC